LACGLLAWLPQFFMEHCGMQLSQLGSFTLLPYLLQGAVGASASLLADKLITKRGWKIRNVRILMQVGLVQMRLRQFTTWIYVPDENPAECA